VINDNKIEAFIEDEIADGGLGDIGNANDWPNEACTELAGLWTDKPAFDLW